MGRRLPVTTYLDVADLERLDALSRSGGKSLSALIREAVKRRLGEGR